MTLEDNIKEWAKITESQINEISDIDVDWDDKTLDDKETQDFVDSAKKYSELSIEDLSYLATLFEDCLDIKKLEEWVEYWKTHEPANKKAAEYVKSKIKAWKSFDNTVDIKRTKREEGL